MKINEKIGVKYLTFDLFDKTNLVDHAFSSRLGGVSRGKFSSMNLGFNRGDIYENVLENYKLFCSAVSVSYQNIVFSNQVHKTKIYHAKKTDRGKGIISESDIKEIDALITNEPNVVLTTFYADCVPLYFLDTKNKVIALAHAGWRGTVGEIGRLTVEEMSKVYGSNPEDILAGIGASIGKCCFEVDKPVYDEFLKLDFADKFISSNGEKYNIDLKQINKQILINAGINPNNIEVTELCTKCNNELFYSHRLMGSDRGTMIAVMQIKEEA